VIIVTIKFVGVFMAIKQIGLSWITTSEATKAKKFFVDTLGLDVFEEYAEYGWLEVKGKQGDQVLGIGLTSKESGMTAGCKCGSYLCN
jgi:hypothetical protein